MEAEFAWWQWLLFAALSLGVSAIAVLLCAPLFLGPDDEAGEAIGAGLLQTRSPPSLGQTT